VYFHALWQQAFAAALSSARECRPAAFGSHAGTETVLAFTRSLGWLIGAFHKNRDSVGFESAYSMGKPGVVNDTAAKLRSGIQTFRL
jgi:hypothetical protein